MKEAGSGHSPSTSVHPESDRGQWSASTIYTRSWKIFKSQQMNPTLELCRIPVPPPPLEH